MTVDPERILQSKPAADDVSNTIPAAGAETSDSLDGLEGEEFKECLALVDRVRRNVLEGQTQGVDAESIAYEAESELRTIGHFQIIRELGRGGSGIVFLAYDPKLSRQVALKVPRPEALLTKELRRRFMREATAAAGLHHPGIVPIYEAGSAEAVCYIVAEYCQGETLSQWITQQAEPVPERTAAHWVALLADAMQHAHDKGVLHRDLKPGNVMMVASEMGQGETEQGEVMKGSDRLDRQPKLSIERKISVVVMSQFV